MWSLEQANFINQLSNKGEGMDSISLKLVCQNCIHQQHLNIHEWIT